MTPKEKAKELVLRFKQYADKNAKPSSVKGLQYSGGITYNLRDLLENAKRCALIAADECYKEAYKQGNKLAISRQEYWDLVKEEIEKL